MSRLWRLYPSIKLGAGRAGSLAGSISWQSTASPTGRAANGIISYPATAAVASGEIALDLFWRVFEFWRDLFERVDFIEPRFFEGAPPS